MSDDEYDDIDEIYITELQKYCLHKLLCSLVFKFQFYSQYFKATISGQNCQKQYTDTVNILCIRQNNFLTLFSPN